LEIVKVISAVDGKLRASHIAKNYQPLGNFLKSLQDQAPPKRYIKV